MLGYSTDMLDNKWYSVIRSLDNKHISTHTNLKITGHIIDGDAHSTKLEGVRN